MIEPKFNRIMRSLGASSLPVVLALALAHAAPQPSQLTFATPQEAAQAAIDAAEHNDTAALLKLFGTGGKDIVESGDPQEDRTDRAEFARLARQKLQIAQDPTTPSRTTFTIGPQEWPFPVPLVRESGRWHYDSAAGRAEVLAHRVGENEVNAVEVCRAYVEAQMEYAGRDRNAEGVLQYAQRIVSSPGKQDGLYTEGAESLVPKAFADAALADATQGGKTPDRFHGYYFAVLKAQGADAPGGSLNYVVKGKMIGGFALVAWPAEYGVSGIQTFIVNHAGLVYEKDLGPGTAAVARQMARFNPDKSWKPVKEE